MKRLEKNGRNGLKSKSHSKFVAFTMIFIFALVFSSGSFAQTGMYGNRSGGWGMDNQYDIMYDTKTVETIVGEVISVEKIVPMKGMSSGFHLMVKTNKETISVHLGPEWFIDKLDVEIIPKDKVEIKGSRITYEGKPAILAAEIIKGDKTLVLRSENGTPVWNGWRQRSGSFAQTGKNGNRSGGWGMGNQYDRMYDTKTVETIVGEVISVGKIVPMKGMSSGVHLMVKTNKETISIHLGPEWFIDKQDVEIIPKDKVEIKGSRITYEDKPAILAAEIIKGDKTLVLRSERGTSVWSGWRQR